MLETLEIILKELINSFIQLVIIVSFEWNMVNLL